MGEFKFCKLSHFSSKAIRAAFVEKNAKLIKKCDVTEKNSQEEVKTKTFSKCCSKMCTGLIGMKSRDAEKSLGFCSVRCLFEYGDLLKTETWNKWVKENGKKKKKAVSIEQELSQILEESGSDKEE